VADVAVSIYSGLKYIVVVTIRTGNLVIRVLHGNADRRGNGARQRVVQSDHEFGIVFRNITLADIEQLAILLFRKVLSKPFSVRPWHDYLCALLNRE